MNSALVFICFALAVMAFTQAVPVRDGWSGGADQDINSDPEAVKYYQRGQAAEANANGDKPSVFTSTVKKGASKSSLAVAQGSSASSFASA